MFGSSTLLEKEQPREWHTIIFATVFLGPRVSRKKIKNKPIGTEPFFPNFLLKEWIVGALFLVAFMLWIVFNPVELTDVANPSDSSYTRCRTGTSSSCISS